MKTIFRVLPVVCMMALPMAAQAQQEMQQNNGQGQMMGAPGQGKGQGQMMGSPPGQQMGQGEGQMMGGPPGQMGQGQGQMMGGPPGQMGQGQGQMMGGPQGQMGQGQQMGCGGSPPQGGQGGPGMGQGGGMCKDVMAELKKIQDTLAQIQAQLADRKKK